MKRYAIVRNVRSRREAEAYLPDNYRIVAELTEREQRYVPEGAEPKDKTVFVIAGEDSHGWTLEDYVIPRYASGLIWAEEIGRAHDAYKALAREHAS